MEKIKGALRKRPDPAKNAASKKTQVRGSWTVKNTVKIEIWGERQGIAQKGVRATDLRKTAARNG